jgi:hypothetical protein
LGRVGALTSIPRRRGWMGNLNAGVWET